MIAIVNKVGDFELKNSGTPKLVKRDSRLFKKLVAQGYTLEHSAYRHQTIPTGKVDVINKMHPEIEFHSLRGKRVIATIGSQNYLRYKSQGKIMVPSYPTKTYLIYKYGTLAGQSIKKANGDPVVFTLFSNKIEALTSREFLREPEVLITKPIKKPKEFDNEPASMFPKDIDMKTALTSTIDTSMITDKEKVYSFTNMVYKAYKAGHKHIIFTISSPNSDRPMYYTIKLSSLLREDLDTGDDVWDTRFVVTRIKEFMAHPEAFKKQTMYVRVREHLREQMKEAAASIGGEVTPPNPAQGDKRVEAARPPAPVKAVSTSIERVKAARPPAPVKAVSTSIERVEAPRPPAPVKAVSISIERVEAPPPPARLKPARGKVIPADSTGVYACYATARVTPSTASVQEFGDSKAEIRRVILAMVNDGGPPRVPWTTLVGEDLHFVETCCSRLSQYIRNPRQYEVGCAGSGHPMTYFGYSVHTMRAVLEGEEVVKEVMDAVISTIYQANTCDKDIVVARRVQESFKTIVDIGLLTKAYKVFSDPIPPSRPEFTGRIKNPIKFADDDGLGYIPYSRSEVRQRIANIKKYLASKDYISLHFYLLSLVYVGEDKFEQLCWTTTTQATPFNFAMLASALTREFEQYKLDPCFIKMMALYTQMQAVIKFDPSKLHVGGTALVNATIELATLNMHPREFSQQLLRCKSERGKLILNAIILELDRKIHVVREKVSLLTFLRCQEAKRANDKRERARVLGYEAAPTTPHSIEDMFSDTVPTTPHTSEDMFSDTSVRNIGSAQGSAQGSDADYLEGDINDCDYVDKMPEVIDNLNLDMDEFNAAFNEGLPADDPAQPVDIDRYDFDFSGLGAVPFAEQVGDDAIPIFYQINATSKNKNSCFADSLRHYGLATDRLGLQSLDDIKTVLTHMGINYVIYNNKFDCSELESIQDSIASAKECKALGVPHKVFMKPGAKSAPTDFRRLMLDPEIIDSRHDCDGPEYKFAIAYGVNDTGALIGHIFVPKEIEYFSKGVYSAVYRVAKKKTDSIMTEVIKLGGVKLVRYIYYDIECNENHVNRKFECNGVSITTFDCAYDMCQLSEAELINQIRGTTTNYIRAGRNDDLTTIEAHPNPHNIYVAEINLANIITSFLKPGAKNIILSFNGAGFDNIFLLQDFMKNKQFIEVSAVGGLTELRSSVASPIAFATQDVKRLAGWVGALQEFTQTFVADKSMHKIANKELFAEMNELYRDGSVLSNRDFVDRFVAYNNLDTESLLLCHARIMRELTAIMGGDKRVESTVSRCISLAQFAMKVFQRGLTGKDIRPKKFALPPKAKLTPEEYKKQYDTLVAEYELIKAAKVGGRCQCRPTSVLDSKAFNMASLDVASLYPFAMMCYNLGYFMAGDPIRTEVYREGCPGVYFGIVTQTLRNNEMPYFCNKTELGNDWNALDKPIKCVITSYEIEHILKGKPHWRYQILFGYYTEQSIRGLDMFASIKPFMLAKAHEDLLKVNKDPAANNGIREMSKAVMNSLSGKFLQAVRPEEIKMTPIDQGLETAILQLEKFTMREEEYLLANVKKDKMLHIGCSIYSLSKIYMYKNVYSIEEGPSTTIGWDQFVYTDTDSNKIVDPQVFAEWMRLRGHVSMAEQVWPDLLTPEYTNLGYSLNTPYFYAGSPGTVKCMGQLEDEYQGKGFTNGIYCDKKEYLVWSDKGKYCAKVKGINCKRILLLDSSNLSAAFDICYRLPGSKKRYPVAEGYNMSGGFWECKVAPEIYEDAFWELNNFHTSRIVEVEAHAKVDPLAHIENIKKLMFNKRAGVKSFVLMKVFKRSVLKTTVRNEFIIKQI